MIQRATEKQVQWIAALAKQLWPDNELHELVQLFTTLTASEDAAIFLALHHEQAVGFAQCQLRFDYVEGTTSSPVGYLEGLYVDSSYREQGYAHLLVEACAQWSRSKQCSELASDCELTNDVSIAVHTRLGFQEANRIVCFTKKL